MGCGVRYRLPRCAESAISKTRSTTSGVTTFWLMHLRSLSMAVSYGPTPEKKLALRDSNG